MWILNTESIFGYVLLVLAVWQFYSFVKGFNNLRTKSNRSTTTFSMFGVWYGLLFAILLLGIGISLVLNQF